MSTTAALGHGHYKAELKLLRAETVTVWMTAVFAWLRDAFLAKHEVYVADLLEAESAPKRYYGAFY